MAPSRTYQVQWEAVVGEHDDEEDDVHQEVQHVGHQLQVEHVHALQEAVDLAETCHVLVLAKQG